MKQKPLNIEKFKIGDIITRIEPSAPLGKNEIRDRSYIGKPLKFLGIANGCVYVEKVKNEIENEDAFSIAELFGMFTGDNGPITLPMDLWSEGWSIYIDPYELGGKQTQFNEALEKYEKIELEEKLKEALSSEDYKRAALIKKRLENLK